MLSKRKSVTFHEDISTVYPKCCDGSSLPVPIDSARETAPASLELDPMYRTWLRLATIAQYPFIVNGTFANHVYHQNFDEHTDLKHVNDYYRKILGMTQEQILARQQAREAAVPALAEKYGSLGWGGLYGEVTKEAWVKNYRVGAPGCISASDTLAHNDAGQEIYRFHGPDEQLLEKIADAFDQMKRSVAEEEEASAAQFAPDGSTNRAPSDRPWVLFTQAGGVLTSPDFGPGGMRLGYRETKCVPPGGGSPSGPLGVWEGDGSGEEEAAVALFGGGGGAGGGFGGSMGDAGVEARMLSAGSG